MKSPFPINLLMQELRAHIKPLCIWSATMIFMILAGIMKYSAFEKTGDAVNEIFSQMPAGILKVMGMDLGKDLTSISVFYSIFFLYFLLIAAVHSTMTGTLIISKEERDHTADFLLVKPITRFQILTAKFTAALINVLVLNLVTLVVSVLAISPYSKGENLLSGVIYVCIGLLFFQLIFLGLGFLLGGTIHGAKAATGMGTGIILTTFALKVLIDLNGDLDALSLLTPFRYFNASDLMLDLKLDYSFALASMLLAVIATIGAYYTFNRRDISS